MSRALLCTLLCLLWAGPLMAQEKLQENLGPCPRGGWSLCDGQRCVSPYTHHREALEWRVASLSQMSDRKRAALQRALDKLQSCLEPLLVDPRPRREVLQEKIQAEPRWLGEVELLLTWDRQGQVAGLRLVAPWLGPKAIACGWGPPQQAQQRLQAALLQRFVAACSPQATGAEAWKAPRVKKGAGAEN